jgi:D-methionine transport system substrate-binding protein
MQRRTLVQLAATSLFALSTLGAASAFAADRVTIKIGASPVPAGDILKFIQPKLAEKGIDLKIVEFSDYVQPNLALKDKELDANFFQHKPFMDNFCKDRGAKLTALPGIFIAPIALYSHKIKDVKEIKKGDRITIPNDPTNGGRALQLLAGAGLLKLKDGIGHSAGVQDIVDNPLKLKIVEVEAATLPRTLDDVKAAVINQTYALSSGLNPVRDAIIIEGKDSPYANIVAVRTGDENRPEIKTLNDTLRSPEVKQFLLDHFKGSLVPSF